MPFDGLNILAITQELNTLLKGARINKIYQPEKDELTLSIRQAELGTVNLLISANSRWARMHLSSAKKENPRNAPAFCMLLRKYLEGGKIKAIKQLGLERIVHITIEALNDFREWEDKILICEFMGKHSNIILVNPANDQIIDAIKRYGHELSSYREVLPGKTYKIPPEQNKINPGTADYTTFVSFMWNQSNKTLTQALFNVYTGISPVAAECICWACGLEPNLPVEQCGEFEFSKIYHYLHNLIMQIKYDDIQAIVKENFAKPLDFSVYPLVTANNEYIKKMPSINRACDYFFSQKFNNLKLENEKIYINKKLKEHIDKISRKIFFQLGDIESAKKKEICKLWGELITAYAYQLKKGDTLISVKDFYSNENIEIKMDPRYTPIENAQKYFKTYNKSRATLRHLSKLVKENQEELEYLQSVSVAVSHTENLKELDEIIEELDRGGYLKKHKKSSKKQEKKLPPRKFVSSEGLTILVGRNNYQNDWLTLKLAGKNDIWLHTKDIPGTHVILQLPQGVTDIEDVPDKSLEEAAALAAFFSQARTGSKVPVDYTFKYNVKKPSGAKPGMVIYENNWTILTDPSSVKRLAENIENTTNE